MRNANALSKPLRIGALWVGISAVWVFWLVSGPPVAGRLYRWQSWHPFPFESVEAIAFAPVPTSDGDFELIPFRELRARSSTVLSFQPPPQLLGTSSALDRRVDLFYGPHPDPSWNPTATLTALDANADGTRYEVAVTYPDGTAWRWRYRASPSRVVPLEWLRLNDTGGILLGPLTVMVWLLGILPARWVTRRLYRLRKEIA